MLRNNLNKFVYFSTLTVLLFHYWSSQLTFADGLACVVVLEGAKKWEDANEQCVKSNKVDEAKLENVSINSTLEEFDFDDNCFIQCVYNKVGILTAEGSMDKKQTAIIFKGNMTADMLKKSTTIWDTCIEEAEKIGKAKAMNACKKLFLHDFCFNKGIVEAGLAEGEC